MSVAISLVLIVLIIAIPLYIYRFDIARRITPRRKCKHPTPKDPLMNTYSEIPACDILDPVIAQEVETNLVAAGIRKPYDAIYPGSDWRFFNHIPYEDRPDLYNAFLLISPYNKMPAIANRANRSRDKIRPNSGTSRPGLPFPV